MNKMYIVKEMTRYDGQTITGVKFVTADKEFAETFASVHNQQNNQMAAFYFSLAHEKEAPINSLIDLQNFENSPEWDKALEYCNQTYGVEEAPLL